MACRKPSEMQVVEWAVLLGGPVSSCVVDVGEDVEVAAVDHGRNLAQVRPDHLGGVGYLAEHGDRLTAMPGVGQRVQRAVDPVQVGEIDHGVGCLVVEVRLAELDPGEDAQVGELMPATLDRIQIADDVEGGGCIRPS